MASTRPNGQAPCRKPYTERRHAPEVFVVFCDLLDALRRHAAASEYVGEKRPNVPHTFGSAEGDDEHRLEGPPCHATTLRI